MIKEAVGFGKTVDEAKEDAMLALGASADEDVQIEIIEMPKKKVLGMFGGSPAKVRVFIELPDKQEKQQQKKQKANVKKENKTVKNKPQKDEEKKPADKPQSEEYGEAVDASELKSDSKAAKAVAYLKAVLASLGCENTVITVAEKENGALISLEGEGLGVIIGRRGETLEALRVLVSLAANKGGGYYRINLNIGDYREKREKALISLANRIAKQVISSGKSRALEPMSPYERRIIHTAVQEFDGVVSSSVGEGENRRVVIYVEGGSAETVRTGKRPRGKQRGQKSSNAVAGDPSREPMKDSNIPLYGKIEM